MRESWSLEKTTLKHFLKDVDGICKCTGVTDSCYQEMTSSQGYRFLTTKLSANGQPVVVSVLRSKLCKGGIRQLKPTTCEECIKFVQVLKVKLGNSENRQIHPKTPLNIVSRENLVRELKDSRSELRKLQRMQRDILSNGVHVSKNLDEGLTSSLIENPCNNKLMELFWKEQKKAFATSPNGMRWHPMLIRFSIYLQYQSPRAYEALRQTGVLRLPNKSTLRDYTNVISPKTGFQAHVFEDLKRQADDLPAEQRYVCLLHDEMSIKADLVYDRRSGDVVGFTNPDTWRFDQEMAENVATHVLVFFVVGVNSPIKVSIGHIPVKNCTADQLFPLLWTAIGYLELVSGLKVISSTSDKASPNQRLYRIHRIDKETVVYKAVNPYGENRHVFFISDAPHLVKTIRNNVNKSKPGGTRYLWNDGEHILWSHVFKVYSDDINRQLYRTKLTLDHVNLTPSSTMSVRLAAQVLSRSVAQIMTTYYSPEMSETAKFFLLCDRFFDCLNVRSLREDVFKRKPDLAPYRSPEDPRFKFLQEEFLGYLEAWEKSVHSRPKFKRLEQNKMFLSSQTYEGIIMTVKAFVEATTYLLKNGLPYVLSQVFCQDPVEEHFGRHRGLGLRHDNPSVYQFGYQENQLRLQRSLAFQLNPKGNTAGRKGERRVVEITSSPLKRIKRH